jgi:hypothetical protein
MSIFDRHFDDFPYPDTPSIVGRGSDISFLPSTAGGMWCPICFTKKKYHWINNVSENTFEFCHVEKQQFKVTRKDILRKHL